MKACPQCDSPLAEDTVKCPQCGKWMVTTRATSRPGRGRGVRGWLLILGVLTVGASWMRWGPGLPSMPDEMGADREAPTPSLDVLRADLEGLFRLQEEHYRNHGVFAGLPSMLGFTTAEGVQVSMVSTGDAWSGTAVPAAGAGEGPGCAVYVGDIPAPRIPVQPAEPGRVTCSE